MHTATEWLVRIRTNGYQCYAQKNALAHPLKRKIQSMNTIALTERYPHTHTSTSTHTNNIRPYEQRKKNNNEEQPIEIKTKLTILYSKG